MLVPSSICRIKKTKVHKYIKLLEKRVQSLVHCIPLNFQNLLFSKSQIELQLEFKIEKRLK